MKASGKSVSFAKQARWTLDLPIAHPVNSLGGYGAAGEVIYAGHPNGCPSVLVDSQRGATATLMSNGSIAFEVKTAQGMEVPVLDGSFDPVEKRERGVPSSNLWLALGSGKSPRAASLINPKTNIGLPAKSIKLVKTGDPSRAMWYCARFAGCETAVRLSLVTTPRGPALLRQAYLRNTGKKDIAGDLWSYFNLHGTQRFVYNKEVWYDCGLPVSPAETVVSARVPYSEILQIKRVSSAFSRLKAIDATCDYQSFVGDTSDSSLMPAAVVSGSLLPGAGKKMNRFSTATIAANRFAFDLAPEAEATLEQSLLFVDDRALIARFAAESSAEEPSYKAQTKAFTVASKGLIASTPGAKETAALQTEVGSSEESAPNFQIEMPNQAAAADYANSVWIGVKELYENCRAHGARLAQGIELGTRDRGQDMWPKMKEDPGRVRADLVHAMSFMYVTGEKAPVAGGRPMTLVEKLHGMFPRQYPSRWDDRSQKVANDNRPYTDSPLWLLNSICMYVRETGDISILAETVRTINLTDPERPETSSIVGCDRTFSIAQVMLETLECFKRHAKDSPYSLAQILYGDWCDPIDMFGAGKVGDSKTRGHGRGVQVRLSAHLVECLVECVDTFEAPAVAQALAPMEVRGRLEGLKSFASDLRRNIVKTAWEDGPEGSEGFLNCIHELAADGSRPDYASGKTGYTLGSMQGRDFDGIDRRELGCQAYCLNALMLERGCLEPVPERDRIIERMLRMVDRTFWNEKLGLVMYSRPIANNQKAIDLAGRMGVVPSGCAENGEYHHCQVFMHRYRLGVPGQADTAWKQFKPIMSALRDETLCGPFETPSTSYASDSDDPHFGKGMYFGLSGSVDWIVEIFHKIAGVELALHDGRRPAVAVRPNLPGVLGHEMTFRRVIHLATGPGNYRRIPLTVRHTRKGKGGDVKETRVLINGREAERAEVASLEGVDKLVIEIEHNVGGKK